MKSQGRQYTVHDEPDDVDRVPRERAKPNNVSLNQPVLMELTNATIGTPKPAGFSDLVGSWVEDRMFDEIIGSQRDIDLEDWV